MIPAFIVVLDGFCTAEFHDVGQNNKLYVFTTSGSRDEITYVGHDPQVVSFCIDKKTVNCQQLMDANQLTGLLDKDGGEQQRSNVPAAIVHPPRRLLTNRTTATRSKLTGRRLRSKPWDHHCRSGPALFRPGDGRDRMLRAGVYFRWARARDPGPHAGPTKTCAPARSDPPRSGRQPPCRRPPSWPRRPWGLPFQISGFPSPAEKRSPPSRR
jgi:hypothetical protein